MCHTSFGHTGNTDETLLNDVARFGFGLQVTSGHDRYLHRVACSRHAPVRLNVVYTLQKSESKYFCYFSYAECLLPVAILIMQCSSCMIGDSIVVVQLASVLLNHFRGCASRHHLHVTPKTCLTVAFAFFSLF